MFCPHCRDQTLEPHHRAGIEIDLCPQCRGVWLDRGELDRLVERAQPSPFIERPDLEEREPFVASASSNRGEPSPDRESDDDDRDRRKSKSKSDSKSKSGSKSKKGTSKKRSKKKSWGELLGDALEEVFD